MTMPGRDQTHRLWDGTYTRIPMPDGRDARVRGEFRFQQGLRPDHAAALDGRQDLAARLKALALWGATAEILDAAIEGLLQS